MESGSLFAGYIPTKVPLSLVATFSASHTNDPNAQHKTTIGTPGLNFLLGSSYGDHIGFFGTWSGQGVPNELYIHFSRLAGRPELNLMVGRFEQSTTVFKTNEALLSRYELGTSAISGHAVSQGRNGIEFNGLYFGRQFLAVGAVQQGDPGSAPAFYYHTGTKIGGINYAGREPDIDLDDRKKSTSVLDDLTLNIDHWGYRSKVQSPEGTDTALIRRLGLDAKVRYKDAAIWGGAMLGYDADIIASRPVHNLTWFGEASYQAYKWMTFIYLYQFQDSSQAAAESESHELGAVFLPFQNVRIQLKGKHSDRLRESVGLQILMGI